MKINQLLKDIKGVFKPPVKRYYIGKIAFGTPYFNPINFNPNILFVRVLKERNDEDYIKYCENYSHFKDKPQAIFRNLPMVRRSKNWIIKTPINTLYVEIGWPVAIKQVQLGWKWKYDSVRFEWAPSFQIYFFNWQFVILYNSPDGDNDRYYEMILHYLKSADKNLKKAEETWGWTDMHLGESTWNKDYIISHDIDLS